MIVYNNIESGMTEVYLGNQSIAQVYIGSNKVFPSDVPPTPTAAKLQIAYSDSTPTFTAACDSTSALTSGETQNKLFNAVSVEIGDCVTSIGGKAFMSSSINSVTIGNSVTTIGQNAFYNCPNLSAVTIPNSVTTIDNYAFAHCYILSSVTLGNSVTTIGNDAFNQCYSLTSIDIPDSVTTIGQYSFYQCSGATSVTIGSGVTSIGQNAFYGCSGLTAMTCDATTPPTLSNMYSVFGNTNNCPIYVPCESVEAYKTAWSAYESRIQCVEPSFSGKVYSEFSDGTSYSAECDSNTSITYQDVLHGKSQTLITSCIVGDCVTEIGAVTFNTMHNLSSITISDNVTTLGGGGQFGTCNNLKRVNSDVDGVINIPIGVTSIANTTIQSCPLITAVTVHDGVTTIGDSFVSSMNGLKTVTIGSGVTSIGMNFIHSCTGLTSITINALTPPTLGSYAFVSTNNCPIYVPCESLEAYKTAWSAYASRIQCISPSFSGKWLATYQDSHTESAECDSISAITSSEITKAYLTDIQIGDCVTSISGYAFNQCTSLTSVTIGSSVTTIGQQAFRYCVSLTSLTIPDSVTSIGDQCFTYCSGLTSVTIGSGLTDIYTAAFEHCSSLTSVTIPNTVTKISAFAFEYCSGLTTVTIGSGVTAMGQDAFLHCSGLTSITCLATTPPTLGNGTLKQFDNTNNCPIYVPDASVNDYKASVGWRPYADRIQAIPNS